MSGPARTLTNNQEFANASLSWSKFCQSARLKIFLDTSLPDSSLVVIDAYKGKGGGGGGGGGHMRKRIYTNCEKKKLGFVFGPIDNRMCFFAQVLSC